MVERVHRLSSGFQHRRVDDVNGLALCVRQDPIEHIRELNLVLVSRHIAESGVQTTLSIVINGW